MIQETYYAVRIGDPKKHEPYFMLSSQTMMPAIYKTKAEATAVLRALCDSMSSRVVRVQLTEAEEK